MSLRRTWLDRGSRERETAVALSAVVMVEVEAQTWRETRDLHASSDLAKSLHFEIYEFQLQRSTKENRYGVRGLCVC